MKKTVFLFIIGFILFSCKNDDDCLQDYQEYIQQIDPTIIAEYHILNSSGLINQKYIFNSDGVMTKYVTGSYIINYSYDDFYKLINISKTDLSEILLESADIIYDSNDRVTQIGDKIYTYDTVGDYYISDYNTTTYIVNNEYIQSFEESSYEKYYGHPIIQMTFFEGLKEVYASGGIGVWEYEVEELSHHYNYDGNNMLSSGPSRVFQFDDNISSLKSSLSNLHYVYGFIDNSEIRSHLNILMNTNNRTNMTFGMYGPESREYYYNFNTNGLPIEGFSRGVYTGIPETNWFNMSYYYYQGDVIPE